MGCSSEVSHVARLIAVDLPPEADGKMVMDWLAAGEERGDWEYEETSIWTPD